MSAITRASLASACDQLGEVFRAEIGRREADRLASIRERLRLDRPLDRVHSRRCDAGTAWTVRDPRTVQRVVAGAEVMLS